MAEAHASGNQGLPKNIALAADHYKRAFDLGWRFAAMYLYDFYSAGLPGYPPRDLAGAERFLRAGADAGIAKAQFILGLELYHLPGRRLELPKDRDDGRQWLELSAQQNYAPALLEVARLYAGGREPGFVFDANKARSALEGAVAQGFPAAIGTQASWYLDKPEIYRRDEKQALHLAMQAAQLNDWRACALLGRMYEFAIGLEYDIGAAEMHPLTHRAMHWYMKSLDLADNADNQYASRRLELFAGLLGVETTFGFRYDPSGIGPVQVLQFWNQEFPATAAEFRQKYFRSDGLDNVSDAQRSEPAESPLQDSNQEMLDALSLASTLFRHGDYAKAMEAFSEVVDLDSRSALAFNVRGLEAFGKGAFDQAIAFFSQSLEEPDDRDLGEELNTRIKEISYQLRGHAWLRQNQPAQALDDFSNALALDDKDPWTFFNRAYAYDELGQFRKAIADSTRAIQLQPDYRTPNSEHMA